MSVTNWEDKTEILKSYEIGEEEKGIRRMRQRRGDK